MPARLAGSGARVRTQADHTSPQISRHVVEDYDALRPRRGPQRGLAVSASCLSRAGRLPLACRCYGSSGARGSPGNGANFATASPRELTCSFW